MKKHIIWNSEINLDDWQDFLEEEHPDVEDEDEKYRLCTEMNDMYLDDERINLNVELPDNIIALADLGLWDGRKSGYKELSTNISSVLFSDCDSAEWYLDEDNNLRATMHHHDGTNYILYRMWKPNLSDYEREEFKEIILSGPPSISEIHKYTLPIGKYIADVYGW